MAYHFGFQPSELFSFNDEDLMFWVEQCEFTLGLIKKGMLNKRGR